MRVEVRESAEQVARLAGDRVEDVFRARPEASVLPATGNTPLPLYHLLAKRSESGMATSRLHVFQLDEFVGVAEDDPRSLYGWMRRVFLEPLHIPESRVTRLRGDAGDLDAECARYDAEVEAAGGIDLAILGLGIDGHLGYNEPPSPAVAPTRVVRLRPESTRSARAYWASDSDVPERGLTAGMAAILGARTVLLLVTGRHKRPILQQMLHGPVGPGIPASYLREHDGATLIADIDAFGSG